MPDILIDQRWLITILCILLTFITFGLTMIGKSLYTKQGLCEYSEGYLPTKQSGVRGLALPLSGSVVFLLLSWFVVPFAFDFFGGGLLVSQLVTLTVSIGNLIILKKFTDPTAGSGHVVYSSSARYVQISSQLASGALLCIFMFAITRNMMIAGGAFYLFFTSIGYFRRSVQSQKLECSNAKEQD